MLLKQTGWQRKSTPIVPHPSCLFQMMDQEQESGTSRQMGHLKDESHQRWWGWTIITCRSPWSEEDPCVVAASCRSAPMIIHSSDPGRGWILLPRSTSCLLPVIGRSEGLTEIVGQWRAGVGRWAGVSAGHPSFVHSSSWIRYSKWWI